MENRPAKTILLIEDDPDEARVICEMLRGPDSHIFELTDVRSLSDAKNYLAGHSVDIILLDLGLVDPHGLEAVRQVRAVSPRVSIVLLSGIDDEAIAAQAIKEGAQDYLIKSQIEPRELVRALLNSAERKKIEEIQFIEKERAQVTLDCIGDAVVCTDTSGKITFLNRVAESMTGWSMQDAAGQVMTECVRIVDALTRKAILDPMAKAASQNRMGNLPLNSVLIRRDGHEVFIEDSVAPIHDREGVVTGAVIVFRDVSATRTLEEELTRSAQHDFLTGLPNRMLLIDRVTQAISLARRQRCQAAVLFLDLDGFKHINDSLGHLIGDKVLQSVARRLLESVRSPDSVSRHGGDEFIVVLQELKRPEDAITAVERLLKTVAGVHSINQHEIYVTTSIGVSVYPGDGKDAETLIKNADTAMYHAKKNGRQNYEFFKPEMMVEAVECQSIEKDLRHALDRKEFTLHYQPKIDLKTGSIVGAEALSRWSHPTRGPVPPSQFIPIAEKSGLILSIGAWVLREACKQTRAWVDVGMPVRTVAVNISEIQLQDDHFLDGLFEILNATGLNPGSLELDIAESALLKRPQQTTATLKVLRDGGVKVSADNFGTGYSSLTTLRELPLDALKIDRRFISRIAGNPDETTKVSTIIEMGQDLNLRVIAEGVETIKDLEFLWAHDCDEAFGYYFGQPVPSSQFGETFPSAEVLGRRKLVGRGGNPNKCQ
jgi:diguanylate cyclase (GGDEF)-like protein/PAS domain S-box-containing protein